MRVPVLIAASLLAIGLLPSISLAQKPWSLEGNAEVVRDGNGPNPWAISLLSETGFNWPHPRSGGAVVFQPPNKKWIFADLDEISADVKVIDFIGGGSPRFSVGVRTSTGVKYVHIYLGDYPNFVDGPDEWANTGNMLDYSDLRFDTSQVGGTFYDSYDNALALVGGAPLVEVVLAVDSGWMGLDQEILVDNVRINNFKLTAKGFGGKK